MKKLLSISLLSFALAACSSVANNKESQISQEKITPDMEKVAFEKSAKECESQVGGRVSKENILAFDSCMSKHGFERVQKSNIQNKKSGG